MSEMSSKAVLITGAGARVGRALAHGLAQDGWTIAVHYNRSRQGADDLVSAIQEAGGQAAAVGANLNVPQELDDLVSRASEAVGEPITSLINNASTFHPDNVQDFSRALFDHHLDINLRAPLLLAQQFAIALPENRQGVIINMIDQRVYKPNPLFFTYSMSKAALLWTTKTMAQALAPNIRVNGVGPGPTLQNTGQTEAEFAKEAASTLLGYGSPPEQLLGAVRYLLSASSVTGQMIAVDSGQHLTWATDDLTIGLDQ